MASAGVSTGEYRNEFFSIDMRESETRPGSYVFRCGISISRFNPICWGRTGICSNPAFKGLQLLRAEVARFALSRGMKTKSAAAPALPSGGGGDGWYQESPLLIEDASPEAAHEILEFSARYLVQSILTACRPDARLPAEPLDPRAMQRFLESLGAAD